MALTVRAATVEDLPQVRQLEERWASDGETIGFQATPMDLLTRFLSQLSPNTYVNVMGQYHPAWRVDANHHAELNRPVTPAEMAEAFRLARAAGLHRFDAR